MRNMSFMLTTEQMRNQTKDVTRRLGWSFLKPGTMVMACVKCQGLGKGGKVEHIHPIKIISNVPEMLAGIISRPSRPVSGRRETEREGFPNMTSTDFVDMFKTEMRCNADDWVNRIEFVHCPSYSKGVHVHSPKPLYTISLWCPFCDEVLDGWPRYEYYEDTRCPKCKRRFGPDAPFHSWPKGIDARTGELTNNKEKP